MGVSSWVCISENRLTTHNKRKTYPRKLKHTSWKVKAVYFWGTQTSKMDHRSNFNYSIRLLNNIKRGAIMSFTGPVLFLNGVIRSCFGFVFVIFFGIVLGSEILNSNKEVWDPWFLEWWSRIFMNYKKALRSFHHLKILEERWQCGYRGVIIFQYQSNLS